MKKIQFIAPLMAMLLAAAEVGVAAPDRVLALGKLTDDPQRDLQVLQPLIDYVALALEPHGVAEVQVIMAPEVGQMVSYLRQGKVQWVTETLGMGLELSRRAGGRIVMNRWKYGEREYRATLFVRRDSPAMSLADVRGLKVGFEHPGSTTGFLVPALEIHRLGIPLVLMGSPRETAPPHMTGYFFSGDEINTSTWVYKRLVDVGAVASTDFQRSYQVPNAFRDELRIIHNGEPLPRAIEFFSDSLDPAIGEALIELLTTAHENEAGRMALEQFQGTTRFERYDPEQWPYVETLARELGPMLDQIR